MFYLLVKKDMTVLETLEISPDGNIARYVTGVTQTTIKTVDSNGYPYYYDRYSGSTLELHY